MSTGTKVLIQVMRTSTHDFREFKYRSYSIGINREISKFVSTSMNTNPFSRVQVQTNESKREYQYILTTSLSSEMGVLVEKYYYRGSVKLYFHR